MGPFSIVKLRIQTAVHIQQILPLDLQLVLLGIPLPHTAAFVGYEIANVLVFRNGNTVNGFRQAEDTALVPIPATAVVDRDNIVPCFHKFGNIKSGHINSVTG